MNFKYSLVLFLFLFHTTIGFDFWNIIAVKKFSSTTEHSWDGGQFSMHWTIQNDVMNMTMIGKTNGWISVGICKTTSMKSCDFWTGWIVDSTNTVILLDTWSTG